MAKEGTLAGESMAGTFDILRANDLIFNYVVSNWLMGQKPPAFDILAWNADSTRMPAAMHAFYLRNFYVENKLAQAELEIAGTTIDLSTIKAPTYVVSAINDHIVPWEAAYKTVGLVSGPVRFVLGSGGHIAGIVSPPGPKAWHLVTETDERPAAHRRGLARGGRAAQRDLVGGLGSLVGQRAPVRCRSRRGWAAASTRCSARPPASTFAADAPRECCAAFLPGAALTRPGAAGQAMATWVSWMTGARLAIRGCGIR